jgi:hypothetical protein
MDRFLAAASATKGVDKRSATKKRNGILILAVQGNEGIVVDTPSKLVLVAEMVAVADVLSFLGFVIERNGVGLKAEGV